MDKSGMTPKLDAEVLQNLELWVESRFHAEFLAIAKMRKEMDVHKAVVEQNSAENQELLLLLRQVKIIISILSGAEKIAVWVTKVAAACIIVWATWKYLISEALKQIKTGS